MKDRLMVLLSVRPMTMFQILYDGGIGLVGWGTVRQALDELEQEGKIKKEGKMYMCTKVE